MNSKIAKERISYVARPDSITTSEGDFLATHVAIKKLKVLEKFDIAPTGGKSFSEEDIFKKYILNPEDRHQFIAIYGQSGTGKSHLIRWFAARYEQSKPKDELMAIRRIWVNDKHEFDDALPRIYERVMGKQFEDPKWIHNENFEYEEWEILQRVCQEMYPDEKLAFEMMYTLIDLENKASGVNQRKGILDDINNTISKTFYKDEDDATQFYSDMMSRRKEHGGKYNEKFLDYQPLESEFEDDEEE